MSKTGITSSGNHLLIQTANMNAERSYFTSWHSMCDEEQEGELRCEFLGTNSKKKQEIKQ